MELHPLTDLQLFFLEDQSYHRVLVCRWWRGHILLCLYLVDSHTGVQPENSAEYPETLLG